MGESYTLQLFSVLHILHTEAICAEALYSFLFLRSIFSFFVFPNFIINHILHFVISSFHSSFCANAYKMCG